MLALDDPRWTGFIALVRGHRNLSFAALDFTDDELTEMFARK